MKKNKTKKSGQRRCGFSLLEMSIVLSAIAILTVSVMQGRELIRKSKITAAINLTRTSPVQKIDNLIAWWETTMPQSFDSASATDGVTVSTWYDISNVSISPNNATAGSAPSYAANAINGLPVLKFNGAQYLNFSGTSLVNTDYTIFVVEKKTLSTGEDLFIGGTGNSTNSRLHLGYLNNTTIAFRQYSNDYNVTPITSSYNSGNAVVHTFRFSSASGKNYYYNGTSQTLTAVSSPVPTQGLLSYAGAKIGANDQYYDGYIAEIIMYSRALSTQERVDVERYLGQKWGVTVS